MNNEHIDIFSEIASSLDIKQEPNETLSSWRERIIYSAAGRVGLCSLYDLLEDEETISITHFKRRVEREIIALCRAGNITSMPEHIQDICDEIYDEYVNTGYLYHSHNRIEPVPFKISSGKYINFIRGAKFNKGTRASGLGYFLPKEDVVRENLSADSDFTGFYDMFHINHLRLDDYYKKLVARNSWRLFDSKDYIEYLRTHGPFSRGYWDQEPDRSGDVSLLRVGQQYGKIYYLYRYENDNLYVSVLPDWMINNSEYLQIANCLLFHRGTLPESVIYDGKDIVYLRLSYLYPPSIQNVIMLYSWPKEMNNVKNPFNRVMNRKAWDSIRAEIELLGYRFKDMEGIY